MALLLLRWEWEEGKVIMRVTENDKNVRWSREEVIVRVQMREAEGNIWWNYTNKVGWLDENLTKVTLQIDELEQYCQLMEKGEFWWKQRGILANCDADDGHRNVCSDILNEGEFSSTPLEDLITMRLCPAFLVPQVRCRPRYVTRYPRYSGFVSVEVSQVLRYIGV